MGIRPNRVRSMTSHISHPTSHTNRTAIGYVRVSTGKQSISLEAQIERIEAYCLLHDFELLDVLEDAAISGKSITARPAMQKLIKLGRKGAMDAVITCKLDRMFRSTVDAITIIPELQSLGVATHIMALGGVSLDTSTPMGGFFLTLAAAFGELERKQIGERTRVALRHKRDHGEKYSAVPPYGWQYVDGHLVEHELEQAGVAAMFQQHHLGAGPTEISRILLGMQDIKPRNARIWSPSTISKILKHPLNIEKYESDRHADDSLLTQGKASTGKAGEDAHVSLH